MKDTDVALTIDDRSATKLVSRMTAPDAEDCWEACYERAVCDARNGTRLSHESYGARVRPIDGHLIQSGPTRTLRASDLLVHRRTYAIT